MLHGRDTPSFLPYTISTRQLVSVNPLLENSHSQKGIRGNPCHLAKYAALVAASFAATLATYKLAVRQ